MPGTDAMPTAVRRGPFGTVALLRRAVRPYPGRVAMLGALVLVATGLQVGVPLLIRAVVDGAIGGDVAGAATMASLVVAFGVAAQAAGLAEAWVATDLGQRTTNDLRAELVRHVIELDTEFHASNPPGALIERVDGDTALLASLFSRLVVEAAQAALVLACALAVTAAAAPLVGAGLAAVLAATGVALRLVVRAGHRSRLARSVDGATLFGVVEERLSGLEDTRATGATGLATWQVERAARSWLRSSFGALAWNGGTSATVAVSVGAMTGVAFVGAAGAVAGGTATLGDVVALLAYLDLLRRPVEQLARQAREVGNAVAGAARVGDLLATRPSHGGAPSNSRQCLPPGALSIDLEGVGVTYPGADRPALAEVRLAIPSGAFVGIAGRTGSGKSTLGRVIARAIAPSTGAVRIGGVRLVDLSEAELRSRVAVVGQEVALFHASVRDNVTLFDRTVPDGVVVAALEAVGLGDWLRAQADGLSTRLAPSGGQGGRPAEFADLGGVRLPAAPQLGGLSAGESQLVGLARAFVRDSGLVVLDEPAARIDPVTEVRLVAALRVLSRGRTVVVVAHRGTTLVDATHVLLLDGGEVVSYGEVATGVASAATRGASVVSSDRPPVPATCSRGSQERGGGALGPAGGGQAPRSPAGGNARDSIGVGPGPRISAGEDARGPASEGQAPQPPGGGKALLPPANGDARGPELARAIWSLVRGYPGWWLGAITLAGITGYAVTLGPGLIQKGFIDSVASGTPDAWAFAAIAVGFGVFRAAYVVATVTVEPWTQSRGAATIATNAVAGILASRAWPPLPVSPGEAVSRLRDDAAVIGRFSTYLGDPVGQVVLCSAAWSLLAAGDPWVAVGAFGPVVTLMAVAQLASPLVARTRRSAAEGVAAVTDLLGDAFAHASAIRLAGANERVVATVVERGEARRRAALREALVAQGFQAAWRHVGIVATGVLLLVATRGLADGSVTAGDAAMGVSLTMSLTFLGEVYGELVLLYRGSSVAFGRIGALLPGRPLEHLVAPRPLRLLGAEPDAPGRPTAPATEPLEVLALDDLTFRYDGGAGGGIEGASFAVRRGSLVAVTGPAGAGKTTLLRAILGVVPATGEARWNDRAIGDLGAWMVPPRAAAVPQVPRLFSGTVRANVLGTLDRDAAGVGDGRAGAGATIDPADARAVEALLAEALFLAGLDRDLDEGLLSLDTRVGPRGLRLSGGQQQRVAAARAFATGASLVVVDDLSSALDEATEARLWDRVLARPGLTVVAVTNRPAVIARASLVVSVEGGCCRVTRG